MGMRIFILWYQILGENAVPDCAYLFVHLVPDFGQLYDVYKATKKKNMNQLPVNDDGDSHRMVRNALFHHRVDAPLSAASTQPKDEQKNYVLLRYLLRFVVTEVDKIQWSNATFDRRHMCFWFLFEQLKRYYFPAIFPKISAKYSIYGDGILPPVMLNPSEYSPVPDGFALSSDRIAVYQEEVVRWLADFLYTGPRALMTRLRSISSTGDLKNLMGNDPARNPHSSEGSTSGIDISSQSEVQRSNAAAQDRKNANPSTDTPISASYGEPPTPYQASQSSSLNPAPAQRQRRNSITFANILPVMEIRQNVPGYFAEHLVVVSQRSVLLEPVLPIILEFCPEYSSRMVSRVRDILFNSRQNINLIHAVFYHASLLPLDRYKSLLCLILVYRTWLEERPVFMKESSGNRTPLKDIQRQNSSKNSSFKDMRRRRDLGLSSILPSRSLLKPNGKTPTPKQSTSPSSPHMDVFGCAQTTYQVMFTNLAHVFLRICPPAREEELELTDKLQKVMVDFVAQQISLCTLILDTVIQPLIQSNVLSTESWEKLLFTLMNIISEVMSKIYQTQNFDAHWVSKDKLLSKMFQTLNTSCIYATLAAPISPAAWDKCLNIYSKLPDCPALFREWKKAMDFLTRQLGKIVFSVDLADLPDESKTNRGRRALGKVGVTTQLAELSRLTALRERQGSGDVKVTSSGSSSSLLTDKPRMINPESPGSNETNSGVEFSLNAGSDEADRVSYDTGAEYLSATEGNSFDGSDIDCYIQKDQVPIPSIDTQLSEITGKEEDDGVALPSSLGSNNESTRSTNRTESSSPDNLISGYASESGNPTPTNVADDNDAQGRVRKLGIRQHRGRIRTKFDRARNIIVRGRLGRNTDPSSLVPYEAPFIITEAVEAPQIHRLSDNVSSDAKLKRISRSENGTVSHDTLTRGTSNSSNSQASTLTKALPEYARGNSVLAGGKELGWNTDSAVVCWRRFLGLLGDFSQLSNPQVMAEVFAYLDSLTNSLLAIDAYQPLVVTKSGAIKPPVNRPPLDYLVPVYLKVLQASNEYIEAKKVAIRILRKILIIKRDLEPCGEMLAQFYRNLHILLTQKSYNFSGEVIRSGCGRLFSYSLPGCGLLVLDFIQAADDILTSSLVQDEALRAQAMSVIVSLLPFQSHFGTLKVLDPTAPDMKVKDADDVFSLLASRLFRGVVVEAGESARQVALCGLLTLCYTNLTHNSSSRFISGESTASLRACLITLLRCARLTNRAVALTAISMLRALTECSEMLFALNPTYPLLIIQSLAWNLAFLWSQAYTEETISPTFKMLLTANISALVEWTVMIPLPILASPFVDLNKASLAQGGGQDRSKEVTCLWVVFAVLEFICSSSATSVQLEPAGLGWVPGCLIPDPLADEVDGKATSWLPYHLLSVEQKRFADELQPMASGGERHSGQIEAFSDQTYFISPIQLTPECIRIAARFARCQLFYQLGRYPLSSTNDVLDSQIQEHHDRRLVNVCDNNNEELTFESVDQPDVQMFVINRSFLLSILTVEASDSNSCDVRIVIRDIAGKYAWDATHIYGLAPETQKRSHSSPSSHRINFNKKDVIASSDADTISKTKLDFLAKLLDDLISQHPEFKSQLAVETSNASGKTETDGIIGTSPPEKWASEQVSTAAKNEKRILEHQPGIPPLPFYGTEVNDVIDSEKMRLWYKLNGRYTVIKQLLSQLGFLSQSRRPSIELLKKSWGLVREIKNLDKQRSRQSYKIAVVYIAPGQEDKQAILSNSRGSIEFERFISSLGWPVNLATHQGFKGGLHHPEDGDFATYFASPTVEAIFHVSTQMPSLTDEDRHRMFKHLGNDEVMIIWTEHWRAFRRSSLRTEFGDVLIIISPLSNGLFRVEIRKEPEVPFFGPLIDGMLVSEEHLPFFVRATAIQANNAINSRKPSFKEHFEERAFYLQAIITSHMQSTAFEDFVMQVALPKPLPGQEDADPKSAPPLIFQTSPATDPARSSNVHLRDAPPIFRMRRRMRNRSESASEQDDFVNANRNANKMNSSNAPEIVTYRVSSELVTTPPPIDVPQFQASSSSTKDQPRNIFNRFSLRHKRRSGAAAVAAQGRRSSVGKDVNTSNR
ncbi:hypothetical protein Aperf_G00000034673 [Anoplocephala perfoliata]